MTNVNDFLVLALTGTYELSMVAYFINGDKLELGSWEGKLDRAIHCAQHNLETLLGVYKVVIYLAINERSIVTVASEGIFFG